MKNKFLYILIVIMLFVLAVQAISSMNQKSPVCDEVSHHIATGYSFLKTKDFRLNSTSPPLTEELCALPLLFFNPTLPLQDLSWKNIDRATFGFRFLYRYNKNTDQLVFWARIPMVILSLLCALLIFIFANDLYGKKAGLFAMFLYVFSPTIIAYSGLAIPDIGATFFITFAIYRFYKFLKKPKPKNIILSGITLGLAEASKLSALILLPLFLILAIWKFISVKRRRYLIATFAILIMCYMVVFAAYFCEVKPLLKNDIDVQEKISYIEKVVGKVFPRNNLYIKQRLIDFALNTPIPFATYIMNILAEINTVFVKDYGAYLFGRYSTHGWWYYYPVVFLLKSPIPILVLLISVILLFTKSKPSDKWAESLGILFLVLFTLTCLTTKLQLSIRYILPIYPLLFIYISKIINVKIKLQPLLTFIILLLSICYIVDVVMIYPDYLAYFNQFTGGADNGWRYLRDANIDYGQDLPALSNYIKENKIERLRLAYFGTADPTYYRIRYTPLDKEDIFSPKKAVYAISVNYFDSVHWTKDVPPTKKIGYSIFIYDFRRQ